MSAYRQDWAMRMTKELEFVHEEYPGYIREFYDLMNRGEVDGAKYVRFVSNEAYCGCFYGWLAKLDMDTAGWYASNIAMKLNAIFTDRKPNVLTYIERWLSMVRYGHTPKDNDDLELLAGIILPFLELPGEEEKEENNFDDNDEEYKEEV